MDKNIASLTSQHGSYGLWLELKEPSTLGIGKLGVFYFPAGHYFYFGSALCSGGIKARLGRHLMGGEKVHWHIDWFKPVAKVRGYFYELGEAKARECLWSRALTEREGRVIARGFGASDCTESCKAHFVYLGEEEKIGTWEEILGLRIATVL